MKFQETETVELKKTTSEVKEAVISIAAMLNKHQRGEVWFGVRNDGTLVGQQVSDNTLRDVSKSISEHIEPKIYPVVERVAVDGKQCIKVLVEGTEMLVLATAPKEEKEAEGVVETVAAEGTEPEVIEKGKKEEEAEEGKK